MFGGWDSRIYVSIIPRRHWCCWCRLRGPLPEGQTPLCLSFAGAGSHPTPALLLPSQGERNWGRPSGSPICGVYTDGFTAWEEWAALLCFRSREQWPSPSPWPWRAGLEVISVWIYIHAPQATSLWAAGPCADQWTFPASSFFSCRVGIIIPCLKYCCENKLVSDPLVTRPGRKTEVLVTHFPEGIEYLRNWVLTQACPTPQERVSQTISPIPLLVSLCYFC